jgi:hypothetical protein
MMLRLVKLTNANALSAETSGMKLISRPVHAVLDYLVGSLLIAAPWLFHFADQTAATYIPVAFGGAAIVYSLFTDYELALVRLLPFSTHLALDIASGVLLAGSPWLFGFADRISTPHLVGGIFEICAGLLTRKHPFRVLDPARQPGT